jgi:hypothetical protein
LSAALWLALKVQPVWVFWAPLAVLVAVAVAVKDARFWIVSLRIATSLVLAAVVMIHTVKFGGPALSGVALGVNLTLLATAALIAPWRKPLARSEAA